MPLESFLQPGVSSIGYTPGTSSTSIDARDPSGQNMPIDAPYFSRQNTSQLILQADGTPYRSSGRFPKRGDDKTYIDFHNLNPYNKVLWTYEGSNGYQDNSYLIFFPREDWYQERQKYSLRSVTCFKSIVDSMVSPVFESKILRSSPNDMFMGLVDNCDNTGTPLQLFIETCHTHARCLGLTFVVMDNHPDASVIDNQKEALDDRKYPYVYEKLPQEVYKWKTNNFGKLEFIVFYDHVEKLPDPQKKNQYIFIQYYVKWDPWTVTMYHEIKDKNDPKKIIEVIDSTREHGLGHLPIYPILDYVKTKNLTKFPTPILSDLANMAFVAYNLESWIMLLSVYQFPILTLPNMDTSQMAISVANAIEIPNDAKFAPGFINPSPQCLDILLKTADRLEDKIYKAANRLGVTGSKASKMVSGISKEWDFRAENSQLMKTAQAAKASEDWIAKTFGEYTGQDVNYTAEYPGEFCEAYSSNRIDSAIALLNGKNPPPKKLASELWQEVSKVYFADDPERAKKINDQIASDYAQALKDVQDNKMSDQDLMDKMMTPDKSNPEQDFKDTINNFLTPKKSVNKFSAPNKKSLKAQA
jgi:hypothetical protein